MTYIKTPTPEEARKNKREKQILKVAEALNHTNGIMISANDGFWEEDPELLVADLNADLDNSIALMTANATIGAVNNAHLDSLNLPKYSNRAPLEIGNPAITLTEQGFVYTPPEDE
jgi:hypothetical protein